jgi:hypothetical protein
MPVLNEQQTTSQIQGVDVTLHLPVVLGLGHCQALALTKDILERPVLDRLAFQEYSTFKDPVCMTADRNGYNPITELNRDFPDELVRISRLITSRDSVSTSTQGLHDAKFMPVSVVQEQLKERTPVLGRSIERRWRLLVVGDHPNTAPEVTAVKVRELVVRLSRTT